MRLRVCGGEGVAPSRLLWWIRRGGVRILRRRRGILRVCACGQSKPEGAMEVDIFLHPVGWGFMSAGFDEWSRWDAR